ncbi:MAG: ammonium transporter [Candidatus Baltobacteraceae bacterium]
MLVSAALVMLMTPALGFFYGGLVRQKNVLSTVMHSFVVLCLVSVQWVLWGYTLAFGPDVHGWGIIGSFAWAGLTGVGAAPNPDYARTIPHEAFMVFQMMFAVITPALITGAFAERKRFKAFVAFSLLWSTLVYDVIAHWVWGHGGWLAKLGVLDFAGGTVVEIASGSSALVAAYVLGRRIFHEPGQESEAHDVPMVILGGALLWFGWFGFNAGSALAANGIAVNAFVTTNTAGAMGALTWITIHWWHRGRPSVVGAVGGSIAGLVGITPAAGYVTPTAAILIGLIASAACYAAVQLRDWMKHDDALDVWAYHGVAGFVGVILTGIFATTLVNPGAADGLLAGNSRQFGIEALAAVVVWGYASGMTYVCLKVVNIFIPLRVTESEEAMGLDISQHAEAAYRV